MRKRDGLVRKSLNDSSISFLERNINFNLQNEVPLAAEGAILKPHLFVICGLLLINALGYIVVYFVLKNFDSRESLHKTTDKLVI